MGTPFFRYSSCRQLGSATKELATRTERLAAARPSDAIALALRLDCPIFVKQSVIDLSASSNPLDAEPESGDPAVGAEEWPDLIG